MSEDCSIVGLGLTVVDLLGVVETYPQVDTKQDVIESRIQVGGPVPTALAQLSKFGHRCRLISRWGADAFGDVIEADLRQIEIDHRADCRIPGMTTGHSQVWVERSTGTRTSLTQRPRSDLFCLSEDDRAVLQRASLLHLDGWPDGIAGEAAEIVKSAGGRVALDTGSPKPGIEKLLSIADIVNAPRRFIEEFLEISDLALAARKLAEFGPTQVTVTDGERGAVMLSHGRVLRVTAESLPRVVDTNGAGDVFTAGVIHGFVRSWSPGQTLRFANAVAGLKCGALGNRSALPDEVLAQQVADQLVVLELH